MASLALPALRAYAGGARVARRGHTKNPQGLATSVKPNRLHMVARAGRDFAIPERLIDLDELKKGGDGEADTTLYKLRFYTGSKQGNGLTEPNAGVMIALIGEDLTTAFLQRIDRYPEEEDVPRPYLGSRFERGNVDEVVLEAPNHLGVPAAIWVTPESGEWVLDEVTVSAESVKDGAIISFPWGDEVGGRDGAAELRPSLMPFFTAEQRAQIRVDGLKEYGTLKLQLIGATGVIVAAGAAAATVTAGPEAARAFSCGGGVGLLYLWLLTRSVDAIPAPTQPGTEPRPVIAEMLQGVASGSLVRLALIGLMGAAGAKHLDVASAGFDQPDNSLAVAAVLGFFTYKIGVFAAGLIPALLSDPVQPQAIPVKISEDRQQGASGPR